MLCVLWKKKQKHAVELTMRAAPSFRLLRAQCECEAGNGERCSHVCGVLFYLAAHAAFLREEAQAASAGSPTSGQWQWGVPKRHIAPDTPILLLNFGQVKEGQPFIAVATSSSIVDPRQEYLQTLGQEDVEQMRAKLQGAGHSTPNCLMLRYATPERFVQCLEGRFYDR